MAYIYDDEPSLKFGFSSNKRLSNKCPFCGTQMKKVKPAGPYALADKDFWYKCNRCNRRIFPARKWEDANWYWLPD